MQRHDFLEEKKTYSEYRKDAKRNWAWIRLLLSDTNITYEEARSMNPDDVHMINAALDKVAEDRERETEKKKKK